MRKPSPKTHLLYVAEYLLSFHNLECLCGAVLRNAKTEFIVTENFGEDLKRAKLAARMVLDEDDPDNFPSLKGLCLKCLRAEPEPRDGPEYIYGVREGQSVGGEENEEAA